MPTGLHLFNYKSPITLKENRMLAASPYAISPWSKDYFAKMELYINDHFPLRNEMIIAYSFIKYKLLRKSPFPKKIVIGQEGWLFLGNEKNGVISLHDGSYKLTERHLDRISNNVVANHDWAESHGIDYYLFIAPDKHSIYSDKLEPSFDQEIIDQKINLVKSTLAPNINLIDASVPLLQARKNSDRKLYLKYDSHWTYYGAYIAYKNIVSEIKKKYPQVPGPYSLDEFIIKDETCHIKTSADMINLQHYVEENEESFTWKAKKYITKKPVLSIPKTYKGLPQLYEKRFVNNNTRLPKILLFRDSFSNKLMKFLSAHFRESIYLSNNHKFDKELILQEKPDIILHEMVERAAIPYLLNY